MRQLLRLHPDSRRFAVADIEVGVAHLRGGNLVLSYVVTGNISDIRMPPVMGTARSNKLWRHTCFEAFVRASSGAEYYEFNFAPSTQWAAYWFDGYRSGMSVAADISAPQIEVQSSPRLRELTDRNEVNASRCFEEETAGCGLELRLPE